MLLCRGGVLAAAAPSNISLAAQQKKRMVRPMSQRTRGNIVWGGVLKRCEALRRKIVQLSAVPLSSTNIIADSASIGEGSLGFMGL